MNTIRSAAAAAAAVALACTLLAGCGGGAPGWCATADRLQISAAEPAQIQHDLALYLYAHGQLAAAPASEALTLLTAEHEALVAVGRIATRDGCPGMKP